MVSAATLVTVAPPMVLEAQAAPKASSHFPVNVDARGIALHGHDPVSYFTAGKPEVGKPEFSATVDGATYHFASAAHRGAFLANPAKYIPQFGGYCAMGVAGGAKYDIDPTAWRVEGDKLYLNQNPGVQKAWLKDVPGNITKATAKWPAIIGDAPRTR